MSIPRFSGPPVVYIVMFTVIDAVRGVLNRRPANRLQN